MRKYINRIDTDTDTDMVMVSANDLKRIAEYTATLEYQLAQTQPETTHQPKTAQSVESLDDWLRATGKGETRTVKVGSSYSALPWLVLIIGIMFALWLLIGYKG